jgi:hypothetical protein
MLVTPTSLANPFDATVALSTEAAKVQLSRLRHRVSSGIALVRTATQRTPAVSFTGENRFSDKLATNTGWCNLFVAHASADVQSRQGFKQNKAGGGNARPDRIGLGRKTL